MHAGRTPGSSGRYRFAWHPSLDGVRGLAALVVVLYHARVVPSFVGAGQAAIETFFVLSGFLITSVLRQDVVALGRIRLRRFYVRRARRLFPALLVYCAVSAAIGASLGWWPKDSTAWSALASATYVMNWVESSLSVPTFFGHTWSLAIEEQFYLTWPMLLLALAACPARWRGRVLVLLLGTSMVLRLAVVEAAGDVERVRNGTDARALGFLLGGSLALALEDGRSMLERLLALRFTAVAGVIAVAAACFLVDVYDEGMFMTWMIAAAVGSAVVVGHAAVTDSAGRSDLLTAGLSSRPLIALGAVSYSLYLWHPLVLEALRQSPLSGAGRAAVGALGVGLSLLVAAASYRFVERPFRASHPAQATAAYPDDPPGSEYDPPPVTPNLDTRSTNGRRHA